MERSKSTLALCACAAAAFLLGSCLTTTNELDLNKELSLDMKIGAGQNGISIPLGSLSKIYLDSLIKTGDDSALKTLEGGLYGFTMDGSIDPVEVGIGDVTINIPSSKVEIKADFKSPKPKDVVIDKKTSTANISISTINLSDINKNLPEIGNVDPVNKEADVPATPTATAIPPIPIDIEEQSVDFQFSYDLPADVEKVNMIRFGKSKTDIGHKITLNVNLKGVYDALSNPSISFTALNITFPEKFTLKEDADLFNYIPKKCVTVAGNAFSISMGDSIVKGLSKDGLTTLPVTLYLQSADFSDQEDKIEVDSKITYSLSLKVSGTTIPGPAQKLNIGVSMLKDSVKMADINVDTKGRKITVPSDKVVSEFTISGLDDIAELKTVTLDEDNSILNLSISDLGIKPFELTSSSTLDISFPSMFVFRDECKSTDGETVGAWGAGNILHLDATKAMGKTAALHIKSLVLNEKVSSDKTIKITNQVEYGGSVEVKDAKGLSLADIEVLGDKTVDLNVWGSLKVVSAEVETDKLEESIDSRSDIDIDSEVDAALVSVSSIEVAKSAGNITLKFNGIPESIQKMDLSDVKITFPSFIQLGYSGTDTRVKVSGNILTIDGSLNSDELSDSGNGYVISGLSIEDKMTFADPIEIKNGHFKLSDTVFVKGKVVVKNQTVDSGKLDEVKVTATASFDPVKVKSVTGKVNPVIDEIHQGIDIDLSDDVDFLKDDKNKLNLSDPRITIDLTSSVTVPILIDLNLSSKDSKGQFIKQDIGPKEPIRLEACDPSQENRKTTLIISKNNVVAPEGGDTVYVEISGLTELMETIPDSIIFDLKASVDQTVEHNVDISRKLAVSGKYSVSIPLSFEDVYIEYSDTVKDLSKDLEDIIDMINEVNLELEADVESTIPLGVSLKATALDKQLKPMDGITFATCTIAAGNASGAVSTMKLGISVKKGALKDLDAIVFTAACQSPDGADASLRKGQYLYLKNLRFNVPDGFNIDLTDTDDK